MAAHIEEFVSRGQKYQTCLISSSRPREASFSPQFPRTREATAEQTASPGSLLSSFLKCAAGFTKKCALVQWTLSTLLIFILTKLLNWNETVLGLPVVILLFLAFFC